MRFHLDHDVPAQVCTEVLLPAGHEAWTAAETGNALIEDDEHTVFAMEREAVVVSCDAGFSRRRQKNAIGRHLYLKCPKPRAADLLAGRLTEVVDMLGWADDITVTLTTDHLTVHRSWH